MQDLVRRLAGNGMTVYSDEDLNNLVRLQIVQAMKSGRFSDALPDPYIHEIAGFAKTSIAEGSQRMCIQLITAERGVASFIYDIGVTDTGVSVSSAVDWHVPKKASDRKVPTAFDGIPRMAIDVSALA